MKKAPQGSFAASASGSADDAEQYKSGYPTRLQRQLLQGGSCVYDCPNTNTQYRSPTCYIPTYTGQQCKSAGCPRWRCHSSRCPR